MLPHSRVGSVCSHLSTQSCLTLGLRCLGENGKFIFILQINKLQLSAVLQACALCPLQVKAGVVAQQSCGC